MRMPLRLHQNTLVPYDADMCGTMLYLSDGIEVDKFPPIVGVKEGESLVGKISHDPGKLTPVFLRVS